MQRLKYALLATALLISLKNNAQNVHPVLDSVLNKTLDSMVTVLNVKSLSAAIHVSNTRTWAAAKGISSVNPRVDVTKNDVYLIGSVAKTITSACILQLADEGVLRLDDSVSRWLDTLQNVNPNITIRQLLRHQSGLYDFLNHPNLQLRFMSYQDSVWTPETLLRVFLREPIAQAGTTWSYCNTNYLLLGMIIKRATGKFYYQAFRERFFTPLNLNTFAIPAFERLTSPVAHAWLDITGDGVTDDAHNFYINYLALNSAAGAAGGYFATPTQTSKWMWTYMRGNLLSANMLSQAQTTVAGSGLPVGTTYGLGLMKRNLNNTLAYGHGGDLVYATSSWYLPSRDLAITVACNDAKNNSWTLIPVVEALLKTYIDWVRTDVDKDLNTLNAAIDVSPNPFSDNLTIQVKTPMPYTNISCAFHNQLGQNVLNVENKDIVTNSNAISLPNLGHLPTGLYVLTIKAEGKIVGVKKVMKF